MNVHFLTPFPKMVDSIIGESILARAQSKGYVSYKLAQGKKKEEIKQVLKSMGWKEEVILSVS